MNYLLDTNAWLRWFHCPGELNQTSRDVLGAERCVGLSPMSIVEVAQKYSKGRLILPTSLSVWVAQSLPEPQIRLLPVTPDIAIASYDWMEFHGDPADRLIASTANFFGLTLITSDKKLLARNDLRTLSTR